MSAKARGAAMIAGAGALLAIWCAPAQAARHDREFYNGDQLYRLCAAAREDSDYASRRAACRAYVLGVSDALQAAQGAMAPGGPEAPSICLGEAEAEPLVEAVTRYLTDHPELRRYTAPDLVSAALRDRYRCQ